MNITNKIKRITKITSCSSLPLRSDVLPLAESLQLSFSKYNDATSQNNFIANIRFSSEELLQNAPRGPRSISVKASRNCRSSNGCWEMASITKNTVWIRSSGVPSLKQSLMFVLPSSTVWTKFRIDPRSSMKESSMTFGRKTWLVTTWSMMESRGRCVRSCFLWDDDGWCRPIIASVTFTTPVNKEWRAYHT